MSARIDALPIELREQMDELLEKQLTIIENALSSKTSL